MTRKPSNRTVLPPEETEQLTKLAEAMREDSGMAALVGPDNTRWDIPSEVYEVLRVVLGAMARGLAITLMPQHTMLTTQEAADLLGVSRPTLVKLLESGEIPYESRGRHRRLLLTDVLDYQDRSAVERKHHLTELAEHAATHDLYSTTATPKPTR
jgi:excisionase family DNA binding protein